MRQSSIVVIVSAFAWMLFTGLLADVRPEFALYWGKLCILGSFGLLLGTLMFLDSLRNEVSARQRQARLSQKQQARRALRVRTRVALLANPKRA